MTRLTGLDEVPAFMRPGYDTASHGIGIVHLGLGAFNEAHQAAITDLAVAASDGDWRLAALSARGERDRAAERALHADRAQPQGKLRPGDRINRRSDVFRPRPETCLAGNG